MKMRIIIPTLFFLFLAASSHAQHIRVRLNFPVGISVGAPGPRPFSGAIWVGPEWHWRGGRYVCEPGRWIRPHRHSAIWVPGHWKYSRRGYKWVPGHWR